MVAVMGIRTKIDDLPDNIASEIYKQMGKIAFGSEFALLREKITHLVYQKAITKIAPQSVMSIGVDVGMVERDVKDCLLRVGVGSDNVDATLADINKQTEIFLSSLPENYVCSAKRVTSKNLDIASVPEQITRDVKFISQDEVNDKRYNHLRENVTHLMYQEILSRLVPTDLAKKIGIDTATMVGLTVRALSLFDVGQNAATESIRRINNQINEAITPAFGRAVAA